ncbi:MAG: hypothetical protein CJBNEKGG_04060 [Prosthecobacter sp.]|nr:hypothetical protein [Prosthecobacter sp.]
MKTTYQRLPAAQDRLLTAIIHTAPTSQGGGELARYDYTYNAQRQIATWRQAQPGMAAKEWAIAYDARQQVSAVVETPVAGPPQNPQQVWRYQYDASGNRIAAQEGSRTRTATYNELNQLVSQTAGGSTWFRGKVNEPANVTINGQNARVSADGTFESLTTVGAGQQDVTMQATDKAGNTTSQTWRVDNGPAGTTTTTHDAEGNLLTDGRYIYTWDARNRMTSVTLGPDTWTFTYDGQNRRIAESKNGQPVRTWVWSGTSVLEERAANGSNQREWSGGQEQLNVNNQQTGKQLMLTDHLESTRVVVDGISGITLASYFYRPWGRRDCILGINNANSGYTGHLWHESGLSLAVFRPYDPETGRWPSRDPIEERGGRNLYLYCNADSMNKSDHLGLECGVTWHRSPVGLSQGAINVGHEWAEIKGQGYGFWPTPGTNIWLTTGFVYHGNDPYTGKRDGQNWETERIIDHPLYNTLRGGKASGKKVKCATCEEITDCIREVFKEWDGAIYSLPYQNCRDAVFTVLFMRCGLRKK